MEDLPILTFLSRPANILFLPGGIFLTGNIVLTQRENISNPIHSAYSRQNPR